MFAGKSSSIRQFQAATPVWCRTEAGGLGNNVAYAVQWAGANRKLLSGEVPTYPSGVNIPHRSIESARTADGTVRSVAPAQKGIRVLKRCDQQVKLWNFEPLQFSNTDGTRMFHHLQHSR